MKMPVSSFVHEPNNGTVEATIPTASVFLNQPRIETPVVLAREMLDQSIRGLPRRPKTRRKNIRKKSEASVLGRPVLGRPLCQVSHLRLQLRERNPVNTHVADVVHDHEPDLAPCPLLVERDHVGGGLEFGRVERDWQPRVP